MRISLIGPSDLTQFDKKDIENYIDAVASEHEISVLAYRSIEIEVLKYFVANIEHASKLTIYSFQLLDNMPGKIQTTIRFLMEKGANFHSFNHNSDLVKRAEYTLAWDKILDDSDLMVSFYDNKKTTLLIPIDEAKRKKKKALIYTLPGASEEKFELTPDKKIRFI